MAAQKPTFDFLTGTETLGTVFSESDQINTKFTGFTLPFSDTAGRVEFNLLGKERLLTLQGATDGEGFTGVTQEVKLRNFKAAIETWVNVNIQTTRKYFDGFGIEYKVHCVDFQWSRSFRDPNRIIYSFLLREVA